MASSSSTRLGGFERKSISTRDDYSSRVKETSITELFSGIYKYTAMLESFLQCFPKPDTFEEHLRTMNIQHSTSWNLECIFTWKTTQSDKKENSRWNFGFLNNSPIINYLSKHSRPNDSDNHE